MASILAVQLYVHVKIFQILLIYFHSKFISKWSSMGIKRTMGINNNFVVFCCKLFIKHSGQCARLSPLRLWVLRENFLNITRPSASLM